MKDNKEKYIIKKSYVSRCGLKVTSYEPCNETEEAKKQKNEKITKSCLDIYERIKNNDYG